MVALIAFQFVLQPADTIAYVSFLRTDLVANVQNLSLYAISPALFGVSVVVMALVALRLANTRWGWPAAVVLTVFATPRLLSYQMSTLLAAFRPPDPPREEDQPAAGPTPLATP
jgi:hypothetical protein